LSARRALSTEALDNASGEITSVATEGGVTAENNDDNDGVGAGDGAASEITSSNDSAAEIVIGNIAATHDGENETAVASNFDDDGVAGDAANESDDGVAGDAANESAAAAVGACECAASNDGFDIGDGAVGDAAAEITAAAYDDRNFFATAAEDDAAAVAHGACCIL
jgi:hypothetical protein